MKGGGRWILFIDKKAMRRRTVALAALSISAFSGKVDLD